MRRGPAIIITLFALAALVPMAGPARAASNPISIIQCFVKVPKLMSKLAGGTQITYVNKGSKTATKVTFQVGYRNASSTFHRKVTDDGQFQPGVQVDHSFDLYNDVTYAGKTVQSCYAVSVRFADGSTWTP